MKHLACILSLALSLSAGCASSPTEPSTEPPPAASTERSSGGAAPHQRIDPLATAPEAPPPPPPPPPPTDLTPAGFPPPPPYTEVQARLRSGGSGAQCFQHNVIQADLTEAVADGDLDGDHHPERVWQTPDCLVVIRQGATAWEIARLTPRAVAREVDRVRLRITGPEGARVLEVTDTRESPLSRESYRYRWDGRDLQSL